MSEPDGPDGAEPSRRANNGKVWIGAAVGAAIIIAAVAWAFSGGTPDSTGQTAGPATGFTGQAARSTSTPENSTTTGAPAAQ